MYINDIFHFDDVQDQHTCFYEWSISGFFHKNLAMAAGSSHDFMEGGILPVALTLVVGHVQLLTRSNNYEALVITFELLSEVTVVTKSKAYARSPNRDGQL